MTSPLAYIYDRNSIISSTLGPAPSSQQETTRSSNNAGLSASQPATQNLGPLQQSSVSSGNIDKLNAMLELHMLALQDIDQRLKAIVEKANAQEAKQDLLWQRISQTQSSNQIKMNETVAPSPVVPSPVVIMPTPTPENIRNNNCSSSGTGATIWQVGLILLGTLILILLIWLIASKAQESSLDRTSTAVVRKLQGSLGQMVDDAVSRSVRAAMQRGNDSTAQSRPYYGSFFQGPSTPQ